MLGLDTRYLSMNEIDGNGLVINGNASVESVPDILGGNTAGEYTFNDASVVLRFTTLASPLSSIAAGDMVWSGLYMGKAATRSMTHALIDIETSWSGGDLTRTQQMIELADEPRLVLIPTPIRNAISGFAVRVLSSAYVAPGVSDRLVIDRPHMYRATHPVPHDVYRRISGDTDFTIKPHYAGTVNITHAATTLTADRTITLDAAGAIPGVTRYKIQRSGTSTGAFNLSIAGTTAALSTANKYVEIVRSGSSWVVEASGTTV